jgi:uncharacterized membrane protein
MAELLTDNWLRKQEREQEVDHQTKIRRQEHREERIERIDVYIQIMYLMVWAGIIIGVWMALTYFLPFLGLLWDVLTIIGVSYVGYHMAGRIYVAFFR